MGLFFYQNLSQDLVKLVIEIGDFFIINKFKEGKVRFHIYFCLKSSKILSFQHPLGEDRERGKSEWNVENH